MVATSSGDGGVAPVPYASVYAASKAAVSCFIEAVAHQLQKVEAPVTAHVFYPGAASSTPGCGRPPATARPSSNGSDPAPPAPGTTFAEFKAQLEAAGLPAEVVDLDWLGDQVLDDLAKGQLRPRPRRGSLRARCCTPGPTPSPRAELPPTLLH